MLQFGDVEGLRRAEHIRLSLRGKAHSSSVCKP